MSITCAQYTFGEQIPLSGGGATYSWSSVLVIAMLTIGCVLAVVFVLYEWKLAPVPIMPREYLSYIFSPGHFFVPSCHRPYKQWLQGVLARLTLSPSTAVPGTTLWLSLRSEFLHRLKLFR